MTIGGQSAGGLSANYHMVIPSSAGLFRAVLSLSGPLVYGTTLKEIASQQSLALIQRMGCAVQGQACAMLSCMQAATTDAIIKVGSESLFAPLTSMFFDRLLASCARPKIPSGGSSPQVWQATVSLLLL